MFSMTSYTTYNKLQIVQLSYGPEEANTFLIEADNHAIVIDVCSMNVVAELDNRGIIPDYAILTHEHVDHLWGLNELRKQYPRIKVVAQDSCSKAICSPILNKAVQYRIYAILRFGENYQNTEAENRKFCCEPADITFSEDMKFQWRNHHVHLVHTPGHSQGSCIIFVDNYLVFSGDMILNEDTFLKFDGGDEEQYRNKSIPLLNSIKPSAIVFPGHGKLFQKKDWKKI